MSEHLQKAAEFLQDAIVHADSVIDATSNITHERRAMENTAFAQAAAAIAQAIRFIITNWADISEYNKIPATEPQS